MTEFKKKSKVKQRKRKFEHEQILRLFMKKTKKKLESQLRKKTNIFPKSFASLEFTIAQDRKISITALCSEVCYQND